MLTVGFGELITDILTVNPAIRSIPSASSILDTSNYTFNAVSLGKDSEGFAQHGHTLFSENFNQSNAITSSVLASALGSIIGLPFLQAASGEWLKFGVFNDQFLTTLRYNTQSPSSYHISATQLQLSAGPFPYNSNPNYPSVYDNRLERSSTRSGAELLRSFSYYDLGHYMNPVIDTAAVTDFIPEISALSAYGASAAFVSSLWNVMGYPPSGNTGKFRLVSSVGSISNPVVSGTLSGVFNTQGVIDKKGFININPTVNAGNYNLGPYISYPTTAIPSNPTVNLNVRIARGDATALALLGGVNHIGVWALDLKEMLKSGLNPPYVWNNINNSRKYKLIAKVTLWENILNHNDSGGISGLVRLNENTSSSFTNNGPTVELEFNFK